MESLALESFETIFSAGNMGGNLLFRRHEEPHQRWKIVMGFDQKVNIAPILAVMQARQIGESNFLINLWLSYQHLLHHGQTSLVGMDSFGSKDLL